MHLESKFTMSLVFATTFFVVLFGGGGGGGYFVFWLSRPFCVKNFLTPGTGSRFLLQECVKDNYYARFHPHS